MVEQRDVLIGKPTRQREEMALREDARSVLQAHSAGGEEALVLGKPNVTFFFRGKKKHQQKNKER
jgi:hypothetical protein